MPFYVVNVLRKLSDVILLEKNFSTPPKVVNS